MMAPIIKSSMPDVTSAHPPMPAMPAADLVKSATSTTSVDEGKSATSTTSVDDDESS